MKFIRYLSISIIFIIYIFITGCMNDQLLEIEMHETFIPENVYQGELELDNIILVAHNSNRKSEWIPLTIDMIENDILFMYEEGKHTVNVEYQGFKTSFTVNILKKDVKEDDFEYKVLYNNTLSIVSYKGKDKYVMVPNTIDGYTVTQIDRYAFSNNSIKRIYIPNTIKILSESSISNNYNLKEVFFEKDSKLTRINDYALSKNAKLEYLQLPNSVISLGCNAFSYTSLSSFKIRNKLVICDTALSNIDTLETLYIQKDVDKVKGEMLSTLSNLKEIIVEEGNPYYVTKDGILYNKDETKILRYPPKKSGTSFKIPDSVDTIGYGAFSHSRDLVNIEVSKRLKTIEEYAFYNISTLESISLPDSVNYIGSYAFAQTSLKDFVFPNEVYALNPFVFDMTEFDSITLSKNIVDVSFLGLGKLENIYVVEDNPYYSSLNGVLYNKDKTELVKYPLGKNQSSFIIPKEVKVIKKNAFNSSSLLTVLFEENSDLEVIEDYGFAYSSLEEITLPNELKSIGESAFSYTSIKNITLPSSVIHIDDNAFSRNFSLESITIIENEYQIIPTLGSNVFDTYDDYNIYVPINSYLSYKNDPNWRDYVDRIFGY